VSLLVEAKSVRDSGRQLLRGLRHEVQIAQEIDFTRSAHTAWGIETPADAMWRTLVWSIRRCSNV
jgi:hypothetical protein